MRKIMKQKKDQVTTVESKYNKKDPKRTNVKESKIFNFHNYTAKYQMCNFKNIKSLSIILNLEVLSKLD